MPSYVVQGRDPRRIADAVIRYQVTQPRFLVVLLVVLVGAGLLGSSAGAGGAVLGVVLFVVLVVLVVAYRRGKMASMLVARGYRPGTTVEARAEDGDLVVTAATGVGRHPWAQVEHVRVLGGIVLFRLREARFVIALPVEAMPQDWAERVGR